MEVPPRMYKGYPGTIDFGRDYQYELVALWCIRALSSDIQDMQIATKVVEYGDLGDVVLHLTTPENKFTYVVKINHQERSRLILEKQFAQLGRFSAEKSITEAVAVKNSVCQNLEQFVPGNGNMYFVQFTNRHIEECRFLQKIHDNALDFLDTTPDRDSTYRYDQQKLVEGGIVKKVFDLVEIHLLCKQIHYYNMKMKLCDELETYLKTMGAIQIDVRDIGQQFIKYITDWSNGLLGGHYYLTRQGVISKLAELCNASVSNNVLVFPIDAALYESVGTETSEKTMPSHGLITEGIERRMFKVRPGTIDLLSDYQYKVAALLCIRALSNDMQDMQIAVDVSDYDVFDDIVLHVQTSTSKITYMMEVTCQAQPKPIVKREFLEDKGRFSIKRHLDCVSRIKERIKSKSKDEFLEFGNIYFVHFNNRSIQRHRFLERTDDPAIAFLDTNVDGFGGTYKYNYEALLVHQLITHSTQPLAKDMYLLCEQIDANCIDRKITNELETWLDTLGVMQINIAAIAGRFKEFIRQWSKGLLGGHHYLTKHDIAIKLTELCLNNFTSTLNRNLYVESLDNSVLPIWNDIMDSRAFTVVESDPTVLTFLNKYIDAEVRKYCNSSKLHWLLTLSEDETNSFYHKFATFKSSISGIFERHRRITVKDVYICLWLVNQLPLLLKVNTSHCYNTINRILKISNYGVKVVIIMKNFSLIETSDRFSADFFTLKDLRDTDKVRVLNRHGKLQGRPAVLRTFIDESMYKYITATDVIHILADTFNVGGVPKFLPRYHTERSLSRVLLNAKVLRKAADEIFLLETGETVSKELQSPNLIICCSKEEIFKQIDNFKSKGKPIHRISIYNDSYLEWKESFGNISTIRNFIKMDDHCWVATKDSIDSCTQTVKIISSKPGMGKTMLLDFIALNASTNRWILRNNLPEHERYYKNSNNIKIQPCDHLQYFSGDFEVALDQLVFCKFLKNKKVLVLLDGFDDVTSIYENELLKITKSIVDDGYNVWLASSPEWQSKLESELNTISSSLKPFSEQDCIHFLKQYLPPPSSIITSYSDSLSFRQSITKEFVEKLLELLKNNLQEEYQEFIQLPFHSKLLGNIFYDEYKASLSNYVVTFNDHTFDLLYLYGKYINNHNRLLFPSGFTEGMGEFFERRQELLALKVLFGDYFLQLQDGLKHLDEGYQEGQNKIKFVLKQECMVVEQSDRIVKHKFSRIVPHRIFAEYLAAKWLKKNCNSKDTKLKKITGILIKHRSNKIYNFLFGIFDRLNRN